MLRTELHLRQNGAAFRWRLRHLPDIGNRNGFPRVLECGAVAVVNSSKRNSVVSPAQKNTKQAKCGGISVVNLETPLAATYFQ